MGLKMMYADRHVPCMSAKRVAAVWHVSRLSTKIYGGFVLRFLIFFSFLDERKEGKRKSRR